MSKCNHDNLVAELRILARLVIKTYIKQGELMANFDKLNSSVDKLDADVRAHEAGEEAATQAAVDAVQVKVDAIDEVVMGTGTSS